MMIRSTLSATKPVSRTNVLTIESSGTDQDFAVEVYDPATPGTVLDSVTYDDGNGPPITVGPGKRARVRDPQEGNTAPVKFIPHVS